MMTHKSKLRAVFFFLKKKKEEDRESMKDESNQTVYLLTKKSCFFNSLIKSESALNANFHYLFGTAVRDYGKKRNEQNSK